MKNLLVNLFIVCLFASCGPKNVEKENLNTLVGEWKTISDEATTLSADMGEASSTLEGKSEMVTPENSTTANSGDNVATCQKELNSLQTVVNNFIENWRGSSKELDRLTNQMQMGNWTEEDTQQLRNLELELRQREVDIAQWRNDFEEISLNCKFTAKDSNAEDSIN